MIVSCASAGIAQSVAAAIVKDNANLLVNLHWRRSPCRARSCCRAVTTSTSAPVDTMVALGGGKVVEAATPTNVRRAD